MKSGNNAGRNGAELEVAVSEVVPEVVVEVEVEAALEWPAGRAEPGAAVRPAPELEVVERVVRVDRVQPAGVREVQAVAAPEEAALEASVGVVRVA